jgi:apolipoprotein N-acyltransferase
MPQILLGFFSSWRTMLFVGSAIAALGLVAYARHEHGVAEKARAQAQVATRQAKIDQATTQAVDHYTHDTLVIREKADHAVQQVERAPGAELPVAPDRRAVLCDALARVRGSPVCTEGDGASEPPGAVQGGDEPDENPS